jgi:3-oxoacyl-[acyl-carrier protein] reductase
MRTIDLKGKVALVTGGAGQLGRAMVRGLAECGADVVICYYSQEAFAYQLQREIEAGCGSRALAVQADVTDLASILAMKEKVSQHLGTVDILVNNAVVQYPWKTVLEQDLEHYESQFRSSVLQSVCMAKAFVPDMKKQRYGRIIGINTECTMQMFPYQSAYISGKRGMDGVYRVLAREVGEYQITVNQVAPGWTISDSCRNPDGTEKNTGQDFPYTDKIPLKKRATDEDIANAVCFLASDLAGSITGVYLPVCGGNVMPCI